MRLPRYGKYKDSGLEWLGQVPAHWPIKRLRFVAELNPSSKAELASIDRATEVSFLPMEAIGDDGSIRLERTRTIAEVETGYTYFRDGDVTVAKITPCFENGKGALMQGLTAGIGFGTTELIVARPKASQVLGTLLNWIFRSPNFRARGAASMYGAGGQKRVPDDFVRNLAWALPPLDEQTAIAAFLDRETAKIDALIAEQEKLIALLAEKRQATSSRAVTKGLNPNAPTKDSGVKWLGEVPEHWQVKPMKHLIQEGIAGPYGSSLTKSMYTTSGYRVYGQQQVIPDNFTVGDYFISKSQFAEMTRYCVKPGDVLVSVMGTIGRAAVVPPDVEPGIINPRLVLYRVNELLITPRYMQRFLNSSTSQEYFSLAAQGTTMEGLNMTSIGELYVALPPLAEQRELLVFIQSESAKLDLLSLKVERGIALLRERRSALIAAAVTGQVDVRGAVSYDPNEQLEAITA